MRGGRLRHRVTLQRRVESQSASGMPTDSYQDLATVSAAVEPLRGREFFASKQTQSDADFRILVRWQPALADLGPSDRALWGSRVFDIRAVMNRDGRNREMELMATEHL